MDGGAWWATVHGAIESRTRLKRVSTNTSVLSQATRFVVIWYGNNLETQTGKLSVNRQWNPMMRDTEGLAKKTTLLSPGQQGRAPGVCETEGRQAVKGGVPSSSGARGNRLWLCADGSGSLALSRASRRWDTKTKQTQKGTSLAVQWLGLRAPG